MTRRTRLAEGAVVAALVVLAAAPARGAIPTITRDKIISIAKSGVGCRYVWGGTCWNPSNKSWRGADCSGYVTKCWQIPSASKTTDCLPHYYTTHTFKYSSTHWSSISRSNMLKADALVYHSGGGGHVVLYASGDKWGNAKVYEARGSAYGIIYRTKYVGSSYVARRRDRIVKPVPTYPKMTIKVSVNTISGQDRDPCQLYDSDKIFDWFKGQETVFHVDVKNKGTAVAKNVKIGVWSEEPYLEVLKWNIYSDFGGSWKVNDTDAMQDIAHSDPGKSFTLWLAAMSPGETKRIKLKVKARKYSVGAADHPDIRAWVANVDGYYAKASFAKAPTKNTKDYQTQNGGDLRAYAQTDVLDEETCDSQDNDCDGETDEGDVCAPPPEPDSTPSIEPDAGGAHVLDPPEVEPDGGAGWSGRPADRSMMGGCSLAGSAPPPLPALLVLAALAAGLWWRRRQRRRPGPG